MSVYTRRHNTQHQRVFERVGKKKIEIVQSKVEALTGLSKQRF